ncbi:MAG: 3'-5' exonuclease [Pseudomonadota bacterium]
MFSALSLRMRRRRYRRLVSDSPLTHLWSTTRCDVDYESVLSLDLETTGLDPKNDDIVSMGWVALERGRIRLSTASHLLIRSSAPIAPSATIHGIREMDRQQGIDATDGLAQLLDAMHNRTLLVHGARLDIGVLDRYCRAAYGAPLLMPVIDTLALAQQRAARASQPPAQGALRLMSLRKQHGLPDATSHNALGDALATAELALAMLPELRQTS